MPVRRLPTVSNAQAELNRRRLADLQSRQRATTILGPEAMQGGKASPARLLWTTLGGVTRPITNADLAMFRRSVSAVGKSLRAGFTAQEIIDFSLPVDRERARKEIPYAIPARLRDGQVVFSTSSGPQSRRSRHMVTVAFVDYGAALSRPGTSLQAAGWLGRDAHLKFDCDCEHHRYRLRYISTIGGFNAGRPESGFPKLTNPTLSGVACKHVLRTMAELQTSAFVRKQVAKMVEVDRARLDGQRKVKPQIVVVTQQQAQAAASTRPRAIRTSDEESRRVVLNGVRTALAKRTTGPTKAEVRATLSALQARTDLTAQAVLAALQQVLQSPAPQR